MLSCADFLEKQIVIIDAYDEKNISFLNDTIAVKKDGKILWKVSCHKIFFIILIGEATLTTVLIRKAQSYGISIVLVKKNLELYALIGAGVEGNTLLRRKQYTWPSAFSVAKKIVQNKIANQRSLLMKNRKKADAEKKAIESLDNCLRNIEGAKDHAQLLGYEGTASTMFFRAYFRECGWRARLPRTKYDISNVLLDIGYTYLFNFIDTLLRLYGFDVYVGCLHQEFYQRKSLACDVMEPFRCLIDQEIRQAFRLKKIREKDFTISGHQYLLQYKESAHYTKIFVEALMKRKEEIFTYVQTFYRSMVKDDDSLMPIFTI